MLPDAVECISYAMPAFRLDGKVVAGFAAFKNHLAYLPHSGTVFPQLAEALEGYSYSDGRCGSPWTCRARWSAAAWWPG